MKTEMRRIRLNELKKDIADGIEQLEKGDSKQFYSVEELAKHIEAEGRKLIK